MNTPNRLLEWLRIEVAKYDFSVNDFLVEDPKTLLPFGSFALFGTGHDRDFMIDRKVIPEELRAYIPRPTVDPNYAEAFSRFDDVKMGYDFLICEERRVEEFRHAMKLVSWIKRDRPEQFEELRTNKPMRVAVFRMARKSFPGSELMTEDPGNPDIDRIDPKTGLLAEPDKVDPMFDDL